MKVMFRIIAILAVAAAVAVAPAIAADLKVGDKVGNFKLKDAVAGTEVELDALRAKAPYTAIVFTNSACAACRDEMVVLAKMQENKEIAAKLNLVAIFTDLGGDMGAKRYSEMFKTAYTYLLDPGFTQPPAFGFQFTPAMAIVDKAGKLLYLKGGFTMEGKDQLVSEVTAIVKK